jgi:dTDP-4-amino-4,6-dideoxy-D-galactose acyltransferase
MLLCTPDLMPAIDLDHRAWDTQHFGYPVASISNSDLEPEAVERALHAAHMQGYQLVYWASRREHDINAPWLREYQGILVDRKTTYVKAMRPVIASIDSGNYQFVEWNPEQHSPELIELGVAAGLWSRFGVDPRIARDKFRSLYEIWMRRSLARELCDMVLVVQEQGCTVPLGMVTISLQDGTGQIGLIAVSEQQRGRGLGRMLVDAADRWMLEHGAQNAQVVTQLQNVAACRLYEQAGYQVDAVEYFYHFWLPARVQAIRA